MEYVRDCGVNYLCCSSQVEEDYCLEMLRTNHLPGLLPLERRWIDEEERLYYRVNGLLSLRYRLEREKLSGEALRDLMESMERLCHSMEEYLLPFEYLLLDPEYVYVRPDGWKESYWVYYGEGNRSGETFLEYLLDHLDYEDRQGVKLLYDLYQSCRMIGGGVEGIREAWRKERARSSERDMPMVSQEYVPKEYPVEELPVAERREKRKFCDGFLEIHEKLKTWIETIRGKRRLRWEHREELVVTESAETTLLTGGMIEGGIYCLRSKSKAYPDLLLISYPFFVGKDEERMDGVVEDAYVSRYHARIDREEEQFRVMDLGSTNGTFLNRERLLPYESRYIRDGDELIFAHREYEFCYLR